MDLESAADVIASGFVLFGLTLAAKPADANHPYGHGRVETLTGLLIGLVLMGGGVLISWNSIRRVGQPHEPLAAFVVWPLVISLAAKTGLATMKFRFGPKLQSDALTADAWNDATDTISAIVALIAVALTLRNSVRFAEADHYGGFAVGLIVISGLHPRSARNVDEPMDTMPDDRLIAQIRAAAFAVPEVRGVEKCFARKTGFGVSRRSAPGSRPRHDRPPIPRTGARGTTEHPRAPRLGRRRPGARRTRAVVHPATRFLPLPIAAAISHSNPPPNSPTLIRRRSTAPIRAATIREPLGSVQGTLQNR